MSTSSHASLSSTPHRPSPATMPRHLTSKLSFIPTDEELGADDAFTIIAINSIVLDKGIHVVGALRYVDPDSESIWQTSMVESLLGNRFCGPTLSMFAKRIAERLFDGFRSIRKVHGDMKLIYKATAKKIELPAPPQDISLSQGSTATTNHERSTHELLRTVAAAAAERDAMFQRIRNSALPPVVMATDASVIGKSISVAWVGADGSFGTAIRKNLKLHVAEMSGIALALDEAARKLQGRRIVILTDSKAAISHIYRRKEATYDTAPELHLARKVREQAKNPLVRIEWVPGHKGYELNEVAHRLALHANREAKWRLEKNPEHRARMVAEEQLTGRNPEDFIPRNVKRRLTANAWPLTNMPCPAQAWRDHCRNMRPFHVKAVDMEVFSRAS